MLQLPVIYKGEEREYPLTVSHVGYTTRYIVDVEGVEVVYERDDSGELRALIRDEKNLTGKLPERELIAAIGGVLEQVLS